MKAWTIILIVASILVFALMIFWPTLTRDEISTEPGGQDLTRSRTNLNKTGDDALPTVAETIGRAMGWMIILGFLTWVLLVIDLLMLLFVLPLAAIYFTRELRR